ncbi:MAG: hypothetical protein JSW39_14220 [Desulfobacterales bacterium]|nr:MAG: hypothetical protein JSW39_14220 [Desulfobacterales bacterium]
MTGIQEILVLVVIVLAVFLLPRVMGREQEKKSAKPAFSLSGRMRLAMAASVFWPALIAAFLKPWQTSWLPFIYVGIGPVILGWVIFWVWAGFRNFRR